MLSKQRKSAGQLTEAFNRTNRRWYRGPYSEAEAELRRAIAQKEIEAYNDDGNTISPFARLDRTLPYRFESVAVCNLWPAPGPSAVNAVKLLKDDKAASFHAMLKEPSSTE
jgi:hypothetical protein